MAFEKNMGKRVIAISAVFMAAALAAPSRASGGKGRPATLERLQAAQRLQDEGARLRGELQVYESLLEEVDQISAKLDRIVELAVTVRDGNAADLGQMVTDAMTVLEERRHLVAEVDAVDPEELLDRLVVE